MSTTPTVQAPIGGQLISSFGGVLGMKPFGSGSPAALAGGNRQPDQSGVSYLDLKQWRLKRQFFGEDSTQALSFGQQGWQVTAKGGILQASIIWDLRNPPDLIAANGAALALDNFNAGFQCWAWLGDDANYPSDIGSQYYWAPSAKALEQTPVVDPNTKKMVGIELAIVSNSGWWKLPAELVPLGKYMTHLALFKQTF